MPSTVKTVGGPLLIFPTEDLRLYSEQIIMMAKAVELDYTPSDPKPSDPIMNVLYDSESGPVAFPTVKGIIDT